MPGRCDSAIDFYRSPFCGELLDAAHPTRFSKERITYGSDVYGSFRGHVWPANTNDEIDDGERLAGTARVPLATLEAGARTYGRLIDNMLRPFGGRGWRDHYLTTYPDDGPVAFTVFDFDRHPPRGRRDPLHVESDEWMDIDGRFWEGVDLLHGLAKRLGTDVMWVTSPGRWLVDGCGLPCRMPGLYAVVRHAPRPPAELRPMLKALRERHGLGVETSWDAVNRNVRIPAQCFMDPCRVDPSRRTIWPIRDPEARTERERNMARLAATLDGYGGLRREGGDRLLAEGADRRVGVRLRGGPPPEAAGRGTTATSLDHTDSERWLREPDTFAALHRSGVLGRALRLFAWDAARADEAVEWMAPRFRRLRPASSATCSDDETLAAFLRRHYLWGCRTYDPQRARASARAKARADDETRIAASLGLSDRALAEYLREVVGLSHQDMASFRRFRRLERRYAGRIARGALYAAFGGQRRFRSFMARHPVLHIAAEHSQSQGRCRQWTLAPRVVHSVRLLNPSPAPLVPVGGGTARERGRVIYIEARRSRLSPCRAVHAAPWALDPCGAVLSATAALSVRGPPSQDLTINAAGMLSRTDGATCARRRRERVSQPAPGRDHGTT